MAAGKCLAPLPCKPNLATTDSFADLSVLLGKMRPLTSTSETSGTTTLLPSPCFVTIVPVSQTATT